MDSKLLFINLYTNTDALEKDFGYSTILKSKIREIIADDLTDRRDEQTVQNNDDEKLPPINPDDFQLYTHPTDDQNLHDIRADYLLRVEGTDVQNARDRRAQMDVRAQLLKFVPEGKTVEVRFI